MARSDGKFQINILAESGVVHEGRWESLFVPGEREPLAILAHHTPMIAKLAAGEVMVRSGKTKEVLATITSGLLYVGENEATVLLDL